MPSPFPGMDPYIETPRIWVDFHHGLAYEISASLNSQIQPRYFARMEAYQTLEIVDAGDTHKFRPDVSVSKPFSAREVAVAYETLTTTMPVDSQIVDEIPLELSRVEIRMTKTDRIITVIEILSPINKRPRHDAHADYLRKRRELLLTHVHFIEIDFLRGGERPPLETPVPPAPYYVMLSRANRRPDVQVWPIQLAHRLPSIPVPLDEPDPDASLDLSALVAAVYERGGYASQIDYTQPAPPPELSETETQWMTARLQAQYAQKEKAQ